MAEKPAFQGDEGDRREMRKIFTETGHRTLNALLIVSGGATVAFMSFLGAAVQQHNDLVARIGADGTQGFAEALQFFFRSVLWAVLAHGTTYASHAAHHYSATYSHKRKTSHAFRMLGDVTMWLTVGVSALCFYFLLRGGNSAIHGFESVAKKLAGLSQTTRTP